MRNNRHKIKPAEFFLNLFKGAARHPFVAFLFLFVAAALTAGWIFIDFQNLYLSKGDQGKAAASAAAGGFDRFRAEKYRKVFSIIEQRENDHQLQAATSTIQEP